MEYLELVFVSTYFETTVLSTLTSQMFIGFFSSKNISFATFVTPNHNITILSKKICDYFLGCYYEHFSDSIL